MRYVSVWLAVVAMVSPSSSFAGEKKGAKPPKQVAGEIVSVEGTVFVRADGRQSTAPLKPAKPGDSIYAGDVVNTSSNGKIKLMMKDKSIMDLGPSALFKVDHFEKNGGTDRQADVSMMYGTLRAAITQKITGKGRFNVRTPTATMGVRGTEFVVKSDVKDMSEVRHAVLKPDKPLPASAKAPEVSKTEITVIQGKVDVKQEVEKPKDGRKPAAAPQVVSLTAGTQLTTKLGAVAPAKAVTVDVKQMTALLSTAKVQDNTFEKAVVIDMSSNSNSNDSGAGAATMAAMHDMVAAAAPAAPPVDMSEFISGVTGMDSMFTHQQPQRTGNVMLRVVVVRK